MFHIIPQAGTLLVRNTKQRQKEMLLPVPNHYHQRLAVTAFYILSVIMLRTCGTKGPVLTANQTPWMRPCMLAIRFGANRA